MKKTKNRIVYDPIKFYRYSNDMDTVEIRRNDPICVDCALKIIFNNPLRCSYKILENNP